MRRKQITLIILLAAVVVLWLTRRWWLPIVFAQIPLIEAHSDLIQAIDALVSIVSWVSNLVIVYFLWMSRREGKSKEDWEANPLNSTKPQDLLESMGQGGRVDWIDRGATRIADLRTHGRIVILGRMKAGKTREATELIRRAVAEDIVPLSQIYEPGPAFCFLTKGTVREAMLRQLNPHLPVLFFVDDLPHHFHGAGLERLGESLAALGECKNYYVVVTARTDQLTQEHQTWLAGQSFHTVELPDLDVDQTSQLVSAAAIAFSLKIDDAARAEFVARRDGTPELPLIGLRRLRAEGISRIDQATARRVVQESLAEAGAETRRYILGRMPAAEPLLNAVAAFQSAGAYAHVTLVLHYAAHLWQKGKSQRWGWRRILAWRQALAYLARFDVLVRNGRISCPEMLVAGITTPQLARKQLGAFLERHRMCFHRPALRWLYRDALPHMRALFDLAQGYQEQGEYEAAVRFYNTALRIYPHYVVYTNRGVAHFDHSSLDQAIADFTQAIALAPTPPDKAAAYYNRGNAYRAKGDLVQAVSDYTQAVTLNPRFAAAYNNRGNVHGEQGQFEESIADLTTVVSIFPDGQAKAVAHYNRGIAYARQGRLSQAVEDYTQAITFEGRYADAYYNRGNAYRAQGKRLQAITDYGQAIALFPDGMAKAEAYYNRGNAYREQGDFDKAIADYSQAIALFPNGSAKANALNNRGMTHAEQGELGKAVTDYDQAIALDPQLAAAYNNRGDAWARQGDFGRAIEDFTRAIDLFPNGLDKARAYNNRGVARADQGNLAEAIVDFTQAIGLFSDSPERAISYANRADAYFKQRQLSQTIEDYGEAIDLLPDGRDKASAHNNRGAARIEQGCLDGAVADYTWAIDLFPGDADKAIALNNRGLAYTKQRQLELAVADFTRAIDFRPEDTTGYRNRASALVRLGRLDEAEMDCCVLTRLAPDHPSTLACLAETAFARGDYRSAVERYGQAAAAAPDPTEFHLELALCLLCLEQAGQAMDIIRERLAMHPKPDELDEVLYKYEAVKRCRPDLPDIGDALDLLRNSASGIAEQ